MESRKSTLGDIADIVMGQSPKGENCNDIGTGLPLLNGPTEFTYNVPKPVQWTTDAKKVCVNGDVLFCVRGSTTGKMNWADQEYAIGRGLAAIRHKNGKEYNEYIRAVIEYKLGEILNSATGSTFPNVSKDLLNNIEIPQISIEKELRISKFIGTINRKIVLNNELNENLTCLAYTLFKEWFVDFKPFLKNGVIETELGIIPNGWSVVTLDDVAEFSNGYAFKSKELLDSPTDDCYRVFKMGHIKRGGGLNANGTKSWIEKEKCKGLDKYILKVGDLLMCMTDMKDNVALLGHTALMDVDNEYIINQRVGLLRSKQKYGIDYPFLYLLTNHHDFIEELRSRANRGVQVNLSTSEIKASKFVMAPEKINDKFNYLVRPIFEEMVSKDKENSRLEKIRDILLPKFMSGEIDLDNFNLNI